MDSIFCVFCGVPNVAGARFCVSCRKLIVLDAVDIAANHDGAGPFDDWATSHGAIDPRNQPPGLAAGTLPLYDKTPACSWLSHSPSYRPPTLDLSQPPFATQPGPHPYQFTAGTTQEYVPAEIMPSTAMPHHAGHSQPSPAGHGHACPPQPVRVPAYRLRYAYAPVPYLIPMSSAETGATQHMVPGSPADFWSRFGALMVDYCVLAVMWFTLIGVAAFVDSAALGVLATLCGPAVYFVGFWANGGRTPGYRASGLQLITEDGTKPTLGSSLIRYLVTIVSWAFFCLGYLWMLWDPHRQTWHDKVAGTRVINLR